MSSKKVPEFTPERWEKWVKDKQFAEDRVEHLEDELDKALDGERRRPFEKIESEIKKLEMILFYLSPVTVGDRNSVKMMAGVLTAPAVALFETFSVPNRESLLHDTPRDQRSS